MLKWKWIIVSCLLSGFLGLVGYPQKASAIPNACNQFTCKNITYWWDGDKTVIKAAYAPGGKSLSVSGYADVFTPSSTFDVPNNATGNKYDLYVFMACTPTCGKDALGVWQALQEVAPVGLSALRQQNVLQFSCTSVAGGKLGPVNVNPVNGNAGAKNTPPGN